MHAVCNSVVVVACNIHFALKLPTFSSLPWLLFLCFFLLENIIGKHFYFIPIMSLLGAISQLLTVRSAFIQSKEIRTFPRNFDSAHQLNKASTSLRESHQPDGCAVLCVFFNSVRSVWNKKKEIHFLFIGFPRTMGNGQKSPTFAGQITFSCFSP